MREDEDELLLHLGPGTQLLRIIRCGNDGKAWFVCEQGGHEIRINVGTIDEFPGRIYVDVQGLESFQLDALKRHWNNWASFDPRHKDHS